MKKKQGRGFVWVKKEEDDLIRSYNTTKMKDLVVYFERSKTAIRRKALKMGLKRNQTLRDYHRGWTEKEEEHLRQNYEFGNLEKIAKKHKRTRKAITERAKLLKLKRDPEIVRKQSCKYRINDLFFNSWGDNMAYVLGLFCADGNMSKSSNNINICLHKNDAYLIKKIYNIMGSTHRVYYDKNVAKFCVDNKHLYNDLLKLGITPNKSNTFK